jgi:hypothetical protein
MNASEAPAVPGQTVVAAAGQLLSELADGVATRRVTETAHSSVKLT